MITFIISDNAIILKRVSIWILISLTGAVPDLKKWGYNFEIYGEEKESTM